MAFLSEKIQSIEFSEVERRRLANAMKLPSSKQAAVVRDKALSINDHRFWKSAQKQFHVTGFRDGAPKARELVLKRAFDSLRKAEDPARVPIWLLYRNSVVEYVVHDLRPLNQLLLKETYKESEGTLTEQIFRCIQRALPIFDASVEQARELYELWGFERSAAIDSLLADKAVDGQAVKRIVATAIAEHKREMAQEFRARAGQIDATIQGLEDRSSEFADTLESLRSELKGAIAALGVKAETSRQQPERNAPIAPEAKVERESAELAKAIAALSRDLSSRIAELDKRIKSHDVRFASIVQPKAEAPRAIDGRKVASLPQFLTSASELLRKKGLAFTRRESVWILFQILRSSRVLITDREALACSLVACLPDVQIKISAASPTWISADSWREELAFITAEGPSPKALVLLDFDVAIQEAYLVPSLVAWLSRSLEATHNRIVLVPSEPDLSQVSGRILEIGFVMSAGEVASEAQDESLKLDDSAVGEGALSRDFLKNIILANPRFERDITAVAQNCGIAFPRRLLENFVCTYALLQQSLPDDKSGRIATAGTLMPWVRKVRGESVARIFQEAVSLMFGRGVH